MADVALSALVTLACLIRDKEREFKETDAEARNLCKTVGRLGRELEKHPSVDEQTREELEKLLRKCDAFLQEFLRGYNMFRAAYRLTFSKDKQQLDEFQRDISRLLLEIAAFGSHHQEPARLQQNNDLVEAFQSLHREDFAGAIKFISQLPHENIDQLVEGQTLLHLATEKGDSACCKLLIDCGALLDLAGRARMTALLIALHKGNVDLAKLLISHGASLERTSGAQFSPLEIAIKFGLLECVRVLIESGADVSAVDAEGQTTLHYAVRAESHAVSMVELLLQTNKVEANLGDKECKTPLFLAVEGWAQELEQQQQLRVQAAQTQAQGGKRVRSNDATNNTVSSEGRPTNSKQRCVELLLAAGALPTMGDNMCHTCPKPTSDVDDTQQVCDRDLWVCGPGAAQRLTLLLTCQHFNIDAGDSAGRTLAYRAAQHRVVSPGRGGNIDGDENPCLDLLIRHHAVFMSRKSAMLTCDEKRKRAVEFAVLGAGLIWAAIAYHIRGEKDTSACVSIYNDLIVPPYMFDLVGVFAFKITQYLYEECLILDFLLAALSWRFGGGRLGRVESNLLAVKDHIPVPSPLKPKVTQQQQQFRDPELGGDQRLPSTSTSTSIAATATATATATTSTTDAKIVSLPWDSKLLYSLFSQSFVQSWRRDKFSSCDRSECDNITAADFYQETPFQFLYLQLLAAYAAIVIALVNIDVGMVGAVGGWIAYTDLGGSLINSPITPYCFSVLSLAFLDNRREQFMHLPLAIKVALAGPLLIMLPLLITHVLPAAGSYPFLVLPTIPLVWSLLQLFRSILSSLALRPFFQEYHLQLATHLALRFLFIFGFHVLFDLEAMLWEYTPPVKAADYIDVLSRDVTIRTQSHCFSKQAFSSAKGVSAFFSWF